MRPVSLLIDHFCFFPTHSSSWQTALLAKILLPFPVKPPGSGPRRKSDEYHHAIRALPSPRNLTSSWPIGQGSTMFNSTPRRHWRTAVGCGHPISDPMRQTSPRRRAGIIDFQYCVTCVAAILNTVRAQLPCGLVGRNQRNMMAMSLSATPTKAFASLPFSLDGSTACETPSRPPRSD
jgi:hypothetical protein